ncbi:MAG TPA: STAS domain-containing protein [Actinocrinis sp.]|nr:STAS domain-containing protein [Actinocrinis sp.]HZP53603.1 STAS domain-containing protein [Actinocrinis sp.]
MRLDAETWDDKGRTVVELSGELDLFTAPVLRDVLLGLTGDGRYFLAVEMSGLRFLDSSGLGVLVGATKRAVAGGGGLCLVGAPQRMLKTLSITGLLRVMPAFTSLEDAFGWLDRLHASRAAAHGAAGNGTPSVGN